MTNLHKIDEVDYSIIYEASMSEDARVLGRLKSTLKKLNIMKDEPNLYFQDTLAALLSSQYGAPGKLYIDPKALDQLKNLKSIDIRGEGL